jgi:hypothetical protein
MEALLPGDCIDRLAQLTWSRWTGSRCCSLKPVVLACCLRFDWPVDGKSPAEYLVHEAGPGTRWRARWLLCL